MEVSDDLSPDALAAALPGRPVRAYPALLATEVDALAWARSGAPDGAVVVADYQVSPVGRAGAVWRVVPGRDLGFSVVLRPQLAPEREGWLYTLLTTAVADVCGEDARIGWPDEVRRGDARLAAVAVQIEPGTHGVAWAVGSVLLADVGPPRAPLLARVVSALNARCAEAPGEVLADHRGRCMTIGRRVSATLLPRGPNARRVTGTAAATLKDGALVIQTDDGPRVAVPPHALSDLEEA